MPRTHPGGTAPNDRVSHIARANPDGSDYEPEWLEFTHPDTDDANGPDFSPWPLRWCGTNRMSSWLWKIGSTASNPTGAGAP